MKWIVSVIGVVTLLSVAIILTFLAMHLKGDPVYLQDRPPDFYDRIKFKLDRAIIDSKEATMAEPHQKVSVFDKSKVIASRLINQQTPESFEDPNTFDNMITR